MNENKILNELNKLLNKAIKHNEVPVAALIIYKNKIISKAYNKVNKKNNILNHAEIIAIKKASKKLKNWRLNDCILYVTLEPCDMCKSIIKKTRIKNIVYYSKQNLNKTENDPIYFYKENIIFSTLLKSFFQSKR
ncbi:MAG: nucleoside deaminase [Bacilli bacterium]|nr:nucleoside deaminase [Bacilli bacterium]